MALARPIPDAVVDLVARRLEVVAQPQRIKLVDALDRDGEMTVHALADAAGVTLYNASQHLAVLRRAGIVRRRQEGRMACYALADPTVIALSRASRGGARRPARPPRPAAGPGRRSLGLGGLGSAQRFSWTGRDGLDLRIQPLTEPR